METPDHSTNPSHDPDCYLCAGNTRINGEVNPEYTGTFVFTNDFAALMEDTPASPAENDDLFHLEAARGDSGAREETREDHVYLIGARAR